MQEKQTGEAEQEIEAGETFLYVDVLRHARRFAFTSGKTTIMLTL